MLRRALLCVQSCQSIHCSRTCTKWTYICHIFQSMLRRDLVCMQSCQSIHCSRTCTKWVCSWHLLSVNAQTSLSMRAVSPEPSLLSHMHKMDVHLVYPSIQCSDAPEHAHSLVRAFAARTLTHLNVDKELGQSLCMFTNRISTYTISTKMLCDGSNIIHV